MSHITKVVIIESHPTMSQGLKTLLEEDGIIQVIGRTENEAKGLEMIAEHRPALVTIGLNSPVKSVLGTVQAIVERFPDIHIAIFTGYDYLPDFNALIEIGVSGIISKSAQPHQIKRTIRCILEGETTIPLSLYRHILLNSKSASRQNLYIQLPERDIQILSLIARGYTNQQIADTICVSMRSVNNYLSNIYVKLGVTTKYEAARKIRKDKHLLPFDISAEM